MLLSAKLPDVSINLHTSEFLPERGNRWRAFLEKSGCSAMYCDPRWVKAISSSLCQTPYLFEARADGKLVGVLPLVYVRSLLFGRFLVSLPYVDWAGVVADDYEISRALVDCAIELADELDVRYLELRHLHEIDHPSLTQKLQSKTQMRLPLNASPDDAWKGLKPVVRTQVRKAAKNGVVVEWGGPFLVGEFYDVFSQNMRELGTPVYPRRLFQSIVEGLPEQAEFGVARLNGRAIASCLAIHGQGLTEVPSASALRAYRGTAANSLMYWHAIERALERGQSTFDFGRSTIGGATYIFKKKWGARAEPAVWQYYVRKGHPQDMRPDNEKYRMAIRLWRRLPLSVTRALGPMIVRGIP